MAWVRGAEVVVCVQASANMVIQNRASARQCAPRPACRAPRAPGSALPV
jgi:hypothetical protein